MLKRCIYNIPFLLIYVFLCSSVIILDGRSTGARLWDNYYIVGIPAKEAKAVIEKGIFGDVDVVSRYSTSFRYNDFGSFNMIMLDEIQDRFIEGDPRVDAFMKGAGQYFTTTDTKGEKYELVYVKSNKSAWSFYLDIRKMAGNVVNGWIFPDFNIRERLFSVFLISLCWIFGIYISGGLRITAIAAGLPWVISTVINGAAMLPAACSIYLFSILLIRESNPDIIYYLNYGKIRIKKTSYFYAAGLVIAVVAGISGNAVQSLPVMSILTSIAAGGVCIYIYYSLKSQRVRMQEHRLFFPVSLTKKAGNDPARNKLPEVIAAFSAVIIIPLFIIFFKYSLPVDVPVPEQPVMQFGNWTWESMDYIDKTYDGLVNAADLLTHEAFQDGFMYDREWIFPHRGEEIILKNFVVEKNKIEYRMNRIQQFTDDWYISIIRPKSSTGLNALLLSQTSPGGVILKSDISQEICGFNSVRHIFISVLAILPVLGQFISSVSITVRRKGQEA